MSSPNTIIESVQTFDETCDIGFFVANCDAWKYRYDDAKKIFQTACSGEVDLWNYAEAQKGAAGSTTNGTD